MAAMEPEVYDFIFKDIALRLNNPEIIYTLQTKNKKFDAAASGIPVIDEVLCGGLPRGRITEIFGPEASGKTTVMLHFIAEAQRRGELVYFIDAEHALDVEYAGRVGVDLKKLLFCQPEYGEQALDTAVAICDSTIAASEKFGKKINSTIVIDSVPALVPKQAFETYEDTKREGLETKVALGLTAAMLARLLPPLLSKISKSNATLVFINQERDNIGVTYGSPTTTPGGRALKFFAALRLKVQRYGYYESGGIKTAIKTQMIPIKSKMFPIFGRKAEFIIGNNGIDITLAMVELLLEREIVKKSGAWLKVLGESFQGREGLADKLRSDHVFKKKLDGLLADTGGHTKPIELKAKTEKPKEESKEEPKQEPKLEEAKVEDSKQEDVEPQPMELKPAITAAPPPATPPIKNVSIPMTGIKRIGS